MLTLDVTPFSVVFDTEPTEPIVQIAHGIDRCHGAAIVLIQHFIFQQQLVIAGKHRPCRADAGLESDVVVAHLRPEVPTGLAGFAGRFHLVFAGVFLHRAAPVDRGADATPVAVVVPKDLHSFERLEGERMHLAPVVGGER